MSQNKKPHKQTRHIRTSLPIAAALALAINATTASAQNFYAGISAGGTRSNVSADEVNALLRSQNFLSPNTDAKRTDTAYRISGGYRISPAFAIEVNYADLGKYSTDSTTSGLAGNAQRSSISARYKSSGAGVDALFGAPLSNGFSIFGRVGVIRAKTEADFSATGLLGVTRANASVNKTGYTYGIGAQYDFNKQFALRAEGQRYKKLGDDNTGGTLEVDVYGVGAVINF